MIWADGVGCAWWPPKVSLLLQAVCLGAGILYNDGTWFNVHVMYCMTSCCQDCSLQWPCTAVVIEYVPSAEY